MLSLRWAYFARYVMAPTSGEHETSETPRVASTWAAIVPHVLITDLSHFEGADPEQHPVAARLAEYLRDIVRCATTTPAGYQLHTGVRCRCRAGRRTCPGHLVAVRLEVPPEIRWQCSSCDEGGVITSGWQGSYFDLGPPRPLLERRPLSGIEISDDEHRLLRTIDVLDPDGQRLIYSAHRDDAGRLLLVGDEDEFEELAGFVAFAANHEPRRPRQKRLDAVFAKLSDSARRPT